MVSAKQEYVNIHGRKGGRGIRPWLLIPKVLCLAIFVGAYVAATMLWFYYRMGYSDGAAWPVRAVSVVFRGVIVPSLFATLLFGVLLFAQHPKVFITRRWLQAKLLIAAALVGVHTNARGTFQSIKAVVLDAAWQGETAEIEAECVRFSVYLIVGLVGAVLLVGLGRLKPRLGQQPKLLSQTAQSSS
jgi:hypothetical protein